MLAGQRRSVSRTTRQDVLRRLDGLRARHRAGLLPAPAAERQTVEAHLRRWLEGHRSEGLSAKHWRNHEAYVSLYLVPTIGGLRLARLTPQHLRALYGRLLRAPSGTGQLGPRSVRGVHTTIRQALDQAVDDGLLPPERRPQGAPAAPGAQGAAPGPADGRRAPVLARGRARPAVRPLAPQRLRRLRQGEVRAFLWSDVNWQDGTLTIARNLPSMVQRLEEAKLPKTAAGARTIRLSPRLLEALRAHRARQAAERLRAGPAYLEQGLVFCTRYGTVLRGENLLRRFKQLLAHAGVAGRYVFHDLRHTAASGMLAAGVPVSEVAELLGHASTNVTTTIYAHAIRRSGRSAVEQLEAFYDGEAGDGPEFRRGWRARGRRRRRSGHPERTGSLSLSDQSVPGLATVCHYSEVRSPGPDDPTRPLFRGLAASPWGPERAARGRTAPRGRGAVVRLGPGGGGARTMASVTDIGALITASPEIRGGRPRIAGTGVTVQRIAAWYRQGLRAEEIAAELPHLSLAQVYAALAYYHANRPELDRKLAADKAAGRRRSERHGGSPGDGTAPPGTRAP